MDLPMEAQPDVLSLSEQSQIGECWQATVGPIQDASLLLVHPGLAGRMAGLSLVTEEGETEMLLDAPAYARIVSGLPRDGEPQSILPSELWFVTRFAQAFPLHRIIESGTYHGHSAVRLSLLFPECEVITWDKRAANTRMARRLWPGAS